LGLRVAIGKNGVSYVDRGAQHPRGGEGLEQGLINGHVRYVRKRQMVRVFNCIDNTQAADCQAPSCAARCASMVWVRMAGMTPPHCSRSTSSCVSTAAVARKCSCVPLARCIVTGIS